MLTVLAVAMLALAFSLLTRAAERLPALSSMILFVGAIYGAGVMPLFWQRLWETCAGDQPMSVPSVESISSHNDLHNAHPSAKSPTDEIPSGGT
jgi:hypothetical protein